VLKMCNALLKRLSKSCNPEVGYGTVCKGEVHS
jgi:hypothetical protein